MSDAIQALDSPGAEARSASFDGVWKFGLYAAAAWAATAIVTVSLPDVVPWGSANLFAILTAIGAAIFVVLAFAVGLLGRFGRTLVYYGPWFLALGLWFLIWEFTTA